MLKHSLTALLLALLGTPTLADDAPIRFPIEGYVVEGNTLLKSEEIVKVLQPFTGPTSSFETIQSAISTLETFYAESGFGAVKALLPEQDLEDGRVRLRVIEARIGHVMVSGNQYFSESNVRASLPALREGEAPNLRQADAQLRVANENSAKQTNLVLRRGAKEGEVDALVRVADDDPLRMAVSLDNTGTPASDGKYTTGRYRMGLIMQHSNLFDRDHSISMQYLTSPDHLDKVTIFGVGYRIPLYSLGDDITLAYGYSNVDSGKLNTSAGAFGISGSGQMYLFRYNQYLPRWGEWLQKLSYGFDYKVFTNEVVDESKQSLVPDSTVHPVSLTYAGNGSLGNRDVSMSLSLHRNVPGGNDGTTADFNRPGGRQGAEADYHLWRYHFNVLQPLPGEWALRGTLQGQETRYALVSGEQFGAGGVDSVRGFHERVLANDKGHRVSIELQTPELASKYDLKDIKLRALAFYDAARLKRNKALPGEDSTQAISSFGIGLRGSLNKSLSLRLDCGVVDQGGGVESSGNKMVHASIVAYF